MSTPLPAVWRPVRGRIVIKMPYDRSDPGGNRRWLHRHLGARIRPRYADGKWTVARPHLRHVLAGLAERFGLVHVYLDFLENWRCDICCQRARGDDCVCQCAGEYQGGAAYQQDWIQVGDTTLVTRDPPTGRRHTIVHAPPSPTRASGPARAE